MLIATTDIPAGMRAQVLGAVRGNIVFSKNIGRDLMAGVKSIAGGEIRSYTDMTNEARDRRAAHDCRGQGPRRRRRLLHALQL